MNAPNCGHLCRFYRPNLLSYRHCHTKGGATTCPILLEMQMIFGGVFFFILENEQNIWCAAFGALLCKWNKLIMLLNNFRVTLQTEESCFILFNFSWFLHFAAYIFIILCCFRHNYIIYHSAKGGVVHLLVCNCLLYA